MHIFVAIKENGIERQIGPFKESKVWEMVATGEITLETRCWHNKLGKDWLPIKDANIPKNTNETEEKQQVKTSKPTEEKIIEPHNQIPSKISERLTAGIIDIAITSTLLGWLAATIQDKYLLSIWIGWAVYWIAFEGSTLQATPGKLLLDLMVININGKRANYWQLTGRHIMRLITYLPICTGLLPIRFGKTKSAIHEHFSATQTIKKPTNL